MMIKAAIETSQDIDAGWVCKLWGYASATEMRGYLHGFHQLTSSKDTAMFDEVSFLKDLCWTKSQQERAQ